MEQLQMIDILSTFQNVITPYTAKALSEKNQFNN